MIVKQNTVTHQTVFIILMIAYPFIPAIGKSSLEILAYTFKSFLLCVTFYIEELKVRLDFHPLAKVAKLINNITY